METTGALETGYSRSLDTLHPVALRRVQSWLRSCDEGGIAVLVYCTERSAIEQARLWRFNRGRYAIEAGLRKLRGLGREDLADALVAAGPQGGNQGSRKTNALPGFSFHQRHVYHGAWGALACDFVPVVGGKPQWNDAELYARAGGLAETAGLTWSGRWRTFRETAHVQFDERGDVKILPLIQGALA